MLDYKKDRLDYGEMLIPPDGYKLKRAIAATYSLDLNTLLSIPIALFYSQTLEGIETGERIQLLEAIQRCPDVIRIYHQKGKINVPHNHNRLYGLIEDCVVGVLPKSMDSAFHPKVWILRFEPEDGPARYRLIVLSRNLTYDRSWDIAATLDGDVTDISEPKNEPLLDFARYLIKHESFDGADNFLDGLGRVKFSPPRGFSSNFHFHPIGIGRYRNPIERQKGDHLICITPFVHEAAITQLRQNVPGDRWLFGRREELRRLKKETLDGIQSYYLSDLIVDGESLSKADDGEGEPLEQRLHAKLFIYKRKTRGNIWFIGSANATKAALERNIEFLLEIRGKGEAVQFERVLDDLLGTERDAGIFEPFIPSEKQLDEDEEFALKQKVRRLEYALLESLKLKRAEVLRSDNKQNFDLFLTLQFNGNKWSEFEIRLAPFNTDHSLQILKSDGQSEFTFENINESNLSRFLRFEIYHKKELQRPFLMKIEIAGMPASRVSKIIKGIISDQDKFFEYLRFLLADNFDKESDGDKHESSGSGENSDSIWNMKSPIFEQLLVTASRRPGRLKDIDEVIKQLLSDEEDQREIVPQEFLTFWEAFQAMVAKTSKECP